MKVWLFFLVTGLAGAYVGARYGGELAQFALPDAGTHGAWYASRGAGIASYLFLWLGLVGGLLMSSAWFDGIFGRARLLAIHQSGTIAAVLLGAAHALVLIPDGWTHFTPIDLFVPFGSYYERLLSAIGTLTLYLSAVVTASFWFRSRIGTRAWRYLHYSSFLAYTGALWHGVMMGTDSASIPVLAMYFVTSLAVVFGLVVRLTYARPAIVRRQAAPRPITDAAEVQAA